MKQFFKISRLIPLCLFLCVSLIVTAAPHFFSFNTVPTGYSGDTPKRFVGKGTVIYGEKSHQYTGDDWKKFSTKESVVYIYNAWYSYHWGDASVSQQSVKGDGVNKLLYELSQLEPTGETAPAVTNNHGKVMCHTKWIQTADKYYRIPNDRDDVIYLLDEYGDYNGKGKVMTLTKDLNALIAELWGNRGKEDFF